MSKIGSGLLATGVLAIALGMAKTGSIALPLGGGWHLTLFPTGVGVLLVIAGVCVLAAAGLYRRST